MMNFILLTESASPFSMTGFTILYILVIGAVMYFFFIRPQSKERKNKAAQLASLEVGDSVKTTAGFIGTVIDLDDEDNLVIVEFGNNKNCRIPMMKTAIAAVERAEDGVEE